MSSRCRQCRRAVVFIRVRGAAFNATQLSALAVLTELSLVVFTSKRQLWKSLSQKGDGESNKFLSISSP